MEECFKVIGNYLMIKLPEEIGQITRHMPKLWQITVRNAALQKVNVIRR